MGVWIVKLSVSEEFDRSFFDFYFFFNDTATTEIYTLSLHDALPICSSFKYCHCVQSPGTCDPTSLPTAIPPTIMGFISVYAWYLCCLKIRAPYAEFAVTQIGRAHV